VIQAALISQVNLIHYLVSPSDFKVSVNEGLELLKQMGGENELSRGQSKEEEFEQRDIIKDDLQILHASLLDLKISIGDMA